MAFVCPSRTFPVILMTSNMHTKRIKNPKIDDDKLLILSRARTKHTFNCINFINVILLNIIRLIRHSVCLCDPHGHKSHNELYKLETFV